MAALKEKFRNEIAPKLQQELGLKNPMAVPRITKITLNMGVGEAVGDKKVLEHAMADMERIAGQKPIVTKSRKSIAGFKIRDGWPIGCKVTLRDERMYEFLDRLINIAIPRVRDFRGISPKQFDGRGNFAMGVTEQIIFLGNRTRGTSPQPGEKEHGQSEAFAGRSRRPGESHRLGACR